MEFQEFLGKQEEVYARFRDSSKIRSEGTVPNIPQASGGYLVILRPPQEAAERIASFSRRIGEVVPALSYDAKTLHTTLSDYGIQEGFTPDTRILNKLSQAAVRIKGKAPVISYSEWLYNPNTVILAGVPDERFLQLAEEIKDGAAEEGIELRSPWGAHITTNRLKEKRNPGQLEDFFRLMQEAPVIGQTKPEFLDVGYFNFSPERFNVTVHERFSL